LDILQQRYARGEIDATTFTQMRERLEEGGALVSVPQDTR
jgi:putative oligomerization/nucleic acid binding protein